jgi:hypothetical protein
MSVDPHALQQILSTGNAKLTHCKTPLRDKGTCMSAGSAGNIDIITTSADTSCINRSLVTVVLTQQYRLNDWKIKMKLHTDSKLHVLLNGTLVGTVNVNFCG